MVAATAKITVRAVTEALDRVQHRCEGYDERDVHLICTAGQDPKNWQFVRYTSHLRPRAVLINADRSKTGALCLEPKRITMKEK